MPKPTPQRGPDPMAGVVDRLLAQLPGLHGHPEPAPRSPPGRSTYSYSTASSGFDGDAPEISRQLLGMWIRVLLALSLSITMGGWPYPRACGLPLFSYLGAVGTVIFAGSWAASASWRMRSGLAHTIALVLVFYGMLLVGSELLPRTGYAVERATWGCTDVGIGPSIVLRADS